MFPHIFDSLFIWLFLNYVFEFFRLFPLGFDPLRLNFQEFFTFKDIALCLWHMLQTLSPSSSVVF